MIYSYNKRLLSGQLVLRYIRGLKDPFAVQIQTLDAVYFENGEFRRFHFQLDEFSTEDRKGKLLSKIFTHLFVKK